MKVLKCSCQHSFQDKQYGKGKRIHNISHCKGAVVKYRCTVCSSIK